MSLGKGANLTRPQTPSRGSPPFPSLRMERLKKIGRRKDRKSAGRKLVAHTKKTLGRAENFRGPWDPTSFI